MLCLQCSQTPQTGCLKKGVCLKDEDLHSLQDTLIFGLKGIAAYAYHARKLNYSDPDVDSFITEALFSTLTNVNFDMKRALDLVLKAGEINLKAMELLDKAHTERFGEPELTPVFTGTKKGHAILVTGHDLLDLYELLRQTENKGINVYTNGEMLPAHSYPEIKKFPHLIGNFGTSWVNQHEDFENFQGAILATTNCVLVPKDSYKDRLFTCGVAGLEGVPHIKGWDFTPLIEKALSLPELEETEGRTILTGFHHKQALAMADKIVEAIKSGKIRHFFLIGGCDSTHKASEYFRKFAKAVPNDCVILTLACGKFRFNDIDFGTIDGIPRLLDVGQCNNAYSAIQIAVALANAFGTSVNELPLSLVVSWFEQKAVAILLTLLYLGIKRIYLGPRPPAFLTPNVAKILEDAYEIRFIGNPEEDLKKMLRN